jgi:hypothetical protein
VIGTGINKTYPSANRELLGVIAKEGLLFSQFWPDAPPPQSSARARARMAVAHGRPVILTDLVVERNDWAKALVNRPGVHVATASGAHHLDASTSTRVRRTSTNDVVALDVERCWHAVASRGVQVAGTVEDAERRQSW